MLEATIERTLNNAENDANHLVDLRAWRLFYLSIFGQLRNLNDFESISRMSTEDAMSALNLGNQDRTISYWQDIRKQLGC